MKSESQTMIVAVLFFLCVASVEAVEPRWVSLEFKTDLGCKVSAKISRRDGALEELVLSCKKKTKVPTDQLWRSFQVDLSKMKVDISPSLTEVNIDSGEAILSGHFVRISIPQVVENGEAGQLFHFIFSEKEFIESYVENGD